MDELLQMQEVVNRVDAGLFARSRAGFYLLGLYPSAADSPVSETKRHAFATSPAISVDEMMSLVNNAANPALAGRFLRSVRKSPKNPWKGRISVGRTSNNDVVIVHPSVSKLHAHFLVGDDNAPHLGGPLQLADAGSRNQTLVNDRPVSQDEPATVECGSRIRFGDVVCTLLDAPALYRTLKHLLPRIG